MIGYWSVLLRRKACGNDPPLTLRATMYLWVFSRARYTAPTTNHHTYYTVDYQRSQHQRRHSLPLTKFPSAEFATNLKVFEGPDTRPGADILCVSAYYSLRNR